MRRGSRGRGFSGGQYRPQNNIPRMLQPQNPQQSHGGPLVTDHLQGLKDIDMELELLKRKREIIEQQQQILSNSYRQRNDYEQPMYESRESRYDDFTRLYNNPGSHSRDEPSRKRPHVPVWDHEGPAKRFAGNNARGGVKKFESRRSPGPLRPNFPRSPVAKSAKKPPPPPQKKKEFNRPNKLPALPAKLANYQPPKQVLKPAPGAAGAPRSAGRPSDDALLLRADREPSHLMVGRLELALGAVLKEVKAEYPQHENLFRQTSTVRPIKQFIRDRIRTAMTGKVITTADVIKAAFRELCPGNEEIINAGLMVHRNKKFLPYDSADPEMYFKKNLRYLMTLKMDEMIRKLREIYCGKERTNPFLAAIKTKAQNTVPKAQKEKTEGNKPDKPETKQEDGAKAEVTETVKDAEKYDPFDNEDTEKSENIVDTNNTSNVTINLTEKVPMETIDLTSAKESDSKNQSGEPFKFEVPEEILNNAQYLALDKLMTAKMVHLLKKFTPDFLNLMDTDAMYRKVKAAIITETGKKLGKDVQNMSLANDENGKPMVIERKPINYYVKIMGKPGLPKRKPMEHFFNEFQPKLIKKHRTVHNLLFVGFCDQEPYEKMLAASGTMIGRNLLDIKPSERSDKKNPNNKTNQDNTALKPATETKDNSTELIGADLDEQITDLLTSIRNSEAVDDDNGMETDVKNEVTNENDIKSDNTAQVEEDQTEEVETDQNSKIDDSSATKVDFDETNASNVNFDETNASNGEFDETNASNLKIDGNQNANVNDLTEENDKSDVVDIKDVPQDAIQKDNTENIIQEDNAQIENMEVTENVEENVDDNDKKEPLPEAQGTPRSAGVRTRRMTKNN